MGNCPYTEAFPIKCCKYKPNLIFSYRYNENSENKEENNNNIGKSSNNDKNNFIENENKGINIINDGHLNNNEIKENIIQKNETVDENDEENSYTSKKIKRNISKIKYSKLKTFKRQLTTEEFIKIKSNKDLMFNPSKIDKLKSNTKYYYYISNQKTGVSNIKYFITKQTTSTTNSCYKKQFNLPVIQEDKNSNKDAITKILKDNIFFRINFNEAQLEKLVYLMTIYEVSPNNNIFNKDDFGESLFVLENGEMYMYNNNLLNCNNIFNCNSILLQGEYSFGELCLLNEKENIKRTYSINSLSDLKFYVLNKDQYCKFLLSEGVTIKSIDINIIKNIDLFKYLNSEELFYISKLSNILDENENDSSNNSNENKKITYISFKEFLNLNINLKKLDPRVIYLKLEIPNEPNKFLIISIHSLIEIFGINFKFNIIFRLFNYKITKDLSLLNNIEGNYTEIVSLYSTFRYKYLEKESSLGIKFTTQNNFIILILHGDMELFDDKNNITKYTSFDLINTNNIQNKTKLLFSLKSIILHAKYEEVKEKINSIKESFSLVIERIYKCPFLSILNNDELLFFLNKMKVQKYQKNDILISEEVQCKTFYIIIEGEVKHKSYEDKTIQKYLENDCFGETFLLDDVTKYLKDTYIYTTSDMLKTVELNKEDFFVLLNNPKINDYIKLKMCLEDKSINFNDLYFLRHLYETKCGNLYLVHNGVYLYVIKSFSRLILQGYDDEKQYMTKKTSLLKSINHKFIVKMVTKFKNDDWYFYLMEYVNGIKFNEALNLFPKIDENINLLIEHVKFYSGIIFIIIDYLHSLKIIHRNIKINNFIIENDGYLKLLDIGSAKKILNGYAKTLLGTPHYMAPEIVEGLNYTYPADYYSIGVCIYYLLYDKYPFGNEENDVYKIYQHILKKKNIFENIENEISNKTTAINELISNLLIKDPNKRLSNFNKIKSSNFFTGFNWDLILSKKLKPPFMPKLDQKFNKENLLNNYGTHFEDYIKNEKTISMERKTSQVKIDNNISELFNSGIYSNIEILKEDEK